MVRNLKVQVVQVVVTCPLKFGDLRHSSQFQMQLLHSRFAGHFISQDAVHCRWLLCAVVSDAKDTQDVGCCTLRVLQDDTGLWPWLSVHSQRQGPHNGGDALGARDLQRILLSAVPRRAASTARRATARNVAASPKGRPSLSQLVPACRREHSSRNGGGTREPEAVCHARRATHPHCRSLQPSSDGLWVGPNAKQIVLPEPSTSVSHAVVEAPHRAMADSSLACG